MLERVYYDGYSNDRGQIIMPKVHKDYGSKCDEIKKCETDYSIKDECSCQNNSFPILSSVLPNLKLDDIILLGIVLIMLSDGSDDKLLLVIVGVIFLLGFNEK